MQLFSLRLTDESRIGVSHRPPGRRLRYLRPENIRPQNLPWHADEYSRGEQKPEDPADAPKDDSLPCPLLSDLLLAGIRVPVNDTTLLSGIGLSFLSHISIGRTMDDIW